MLFGKTYHYKFTLLELLIVIAIIAILTAILLPSLQKVREKGKQITCVNILKQIGFAKESYSNDYTDYIVPVLMTSSLRWYMLLNRQLGKKDSDSDITSCPSWDRIAPNNITYVFGLNLIIHGWNEAVYGDTYPMHKRNYLLKPSKSLSVADNQKNFNDLVNGVSDLSFRHLKRVNVLYQDVHVENLNQNGLAGNAGGNINKILTTR